MGKLPAARLSPKQQYALAGSICSFSVQCNLQSHKPAIKRPYMLHDLKSCPVSDPRARLVPSLPSTDRSAPRHHHHASQYRCSYSKVSSAASDPAQFTRAPAVRPNSKSWSGSVGGVSPAFYSLQSLPRLFPSFPCDAQPYRADQSVACSACATHLARLGSPDRQHLLGKHLRRSWLRRGR